MRENKMKQILDEGKLAVGMGIFTAASGQPHIPAVRLYRLI